MLDHNLGAVTMISPAVMVTPVMAPLDNHGVTMTAPKVAMIVAVAALDDDFSLFSLCRGSEREGDADSRDR